ncbi:hypothetical protein [Bacillus cereus group sp. IBL03679]|uniref:hypothetical protein n=1 Tax=Bacillus cereus group sp. IBL03679 TaxID=3240095 RepID=UPI003D2F6DCD
MSSTESLQDTYRETESTGETPYVGSNNTMNVPSNRYAGNFGPGNNNMNNQSESFGFNPYGDQNVSYGMNAYSSYSNMTKNHGMGCGCGCNTNAYSNENDMMNYPSNNAEMNAYSNSTNMPN